MAIINLSVELPEELVGSFLQAVRDFDGEPFTVEQLKTIFNQVCPPFEETSGGRKHGKN